MKNDIKSIEPSVMQGIIEAKSAHSMKVKKYNPLIRSISYCISLLAIIMIFELKTIDRGSSVALASIAENFDELVDIPLTKIPPPPKPVQQPQLIEIPDDKIIEEEIPINLDINMNEEDIIEDIVTDAMPEEEAAPTIFQIVQQMPTPKGGMAAFYKFINKNLNYPHQASKMGIEGRVFLSFIIEADGSLSNIKVMKGIGAGCDEESIRVMKKAPKWNPGKQRGRPVPVRFALSIVFKLS